jgi:hypothetical protein
LFGSVETRSSEQRVLDSTVAVLGVVDALRAGVLEEPFRQRDSVAAAFMAAAHPASGALVHTVVADVEQIATERTVALEPNRDDLHIFLTNSVAI